LEKHPVYLVVLSTAVCRGIGCVLASEKRFWNDELFMFYISRQRSLGDVWNISLTVADQTPPIFILITRASTTLFGSGGFAFRLGRGLDIRIGNAWKSSLPDLLIVVVREREYVLYYEKCPGLII
jgi:hypothetical protein